MQLRRQWGECLGLDGSFFDGCQKTSTIVNHEQGSIYCMLGMRLFSKKELLVGKGKDVIGRLNSTGCFDESISSTYPYHGKISTFIYAVVRYQKKNPKCLFQVLRYAERWYWRRITEFCLNLFDAMLSSHFSHYFTKDVILSCQNFPICREWTRQIMDFLWGLVLVIIN